MTIRSATDADWPGIPLLDEHSAYPPTHPADVHLSLDVLGSLYLGSHRASTFGAANRLRSNDSGLITRIDAAFASDVTAELGFGFGF